VKEAGNERPQETGGRTRIALCSGAFADERPGQRLRRPGDVRPAGSACGPWRSARIRSGCLIMEKKHSSEMAAADVLGLRRKARVGGEGASPEIIFRPEQLPPEGAFARLMPYLPGILLALAIVGIPLAFQWLARS